MVLRTLCSRPASPVARYQDAEKRILNGKSQMENGKWLAICHLPFAISDQAGIFQRPATRLAVIRCGRWPLIANLVHTTQFRHQTRPAPLKTGLSPVGTSVAPANHA
jgi:hypothetical protein